MVRVWDKKCVTPLHRDDATAHLSRDFPENYPVSSKGGSKCPGIKVDSRYPEFEGIIGVMHTQV